MQVSEVTYMGNQIKWPVIQQIQKCTILDPTELVGVNITAEVFIEFKYEESNKKHSFA